MSNFYQEDPNYRPWGMNVNQFCMLMHLAQLLGLIIPLAGFILPIVMWATNNDKSEVVNRHGKHIFNWMLSLLIYGSIAWMLRFLIIGFPIFWMLVIAGVVLPVIGGVRANDGLDYRYPFSINFFKN